jgi:hypothetical protein
LDAKNATPSKSGDKSAAPIVRRLGSGVAPQSWTHFGSKGQKPKRAELGRRMPTTPITQIQAGFADLAATAPRITTAPTITKAHKRSWLE